MVKILMPPSIGIQGGGQQGGPEGGPGCEKQVTENNINIIPSVYLFMRLQKYVFIYFK
jgi:hypothetical protein